MDYPRAQSKFVIFALLALVGVCIYAANPALPKWTAFSRLPWHDLTGFSPIGSPASLPKTAAGEQAVITTSADTDRRKLRAETDLFPLQGDLLELEIAGEGIQHLTAAVIAEDKSVLSDIDLGTDAASLNGTVWTPRRIHVASGTVGKRASLIIRAQRSGNAGWLAIRNRIDFYKSSKLPAVHLFPAEMLIVAVAAFWLYLISAKPPSRKWQYLIFLALSCLFQLRISPYFYWDEWHVLERFGKLGFPGVVYTHNEHFLPLFFSWYFIEARLLADNYVFYLLVSSLIHALNALLFVVLLRRLGEWLPCIDRAAFLFGCLFAANSLHGETLQWSLEQTILLAQLFTFLGLLGALQFLKSGELRYALLAGASALLAPLCFGNGFSLALQYGVIFAFVYFTSRLSLRRMAGILILAGAFAAGAAYLYDTHKESTGHGVEQAKPFDNLGSVFEYLEVGTQNGAILRGLGIFPDLAPESAAKFFKDADIHIDHPLVFLAHAGFVVSLICLAIGARDPSRRRFAIAIWLAGQGILFSCMILPAFGRWELGSGQSLSLRYHYSTLLGAFLVALPAVSQLLVWAENAHGRFYKALFPTVIMLSFCSHYYAARHFTYFTKQGFEHRLYISQLVDWEKKLQSLPPGIDYEASGTEYAGLNPVHRSTITPGRHPNEIYAVLKWLTGP